MKKEEEILSRITGYSVHELHERLTEPILQPYDCLMAMIEFAQQQVKNLNIPAVVGRSEQLFCGRNVTTCIYFDEGKCKHEPFECRDQVVK